jgi:CelD/BcsL family acetyltransferase involved in cellulose biosynthesis
MIERHGSIDSLAAEWDELADTAGAPPWSRPGWIDAWWPAFGRGRLEILAVRRNGELAGVLPLAVRAWVRAAPANWHTPEFAPLAADGAARDEITRALLSGRARRVELRFVPGDDDPALPACRAAARLMGWRSLERSVEESPFLHLGGTWEAYVGTLRRSFKADLRRRRRRLAEAGTVTVEVGRGNDRLDALLTEGFAIEGSGWKTAQGTAISSHAETERFYRAVARWAAGRGWLRLAFLRLDGRPMAFHFNVVQGGALYHLKGGYDPAYERFSPSRLLHCEMIERAFADGLRSYEFLGAVEPWKLEWTSSVRDRLAFQAFPPAVAGRIEWAAFAYGRPLAQRVLARMGR